MTLEPATLYIGNRRYSSWSLRGWLAVRLSGLPAEAEVIPLKGGVTPEVRAVSPSGFVPYLEHDGAKIWDSLAILEYCAEIAPALWPSERIARAHARAIAAEMHSGFRELRLAMPMNCCRTFPGHGQNDGSLADIARIEAIWTETRARFGANGPFLFGAGFTGADVMFAPVASRFLTYAPPLSKPALAYVQAVRAHSLVAEWYRLAATEPESWQIEKYETIS
ncbi:glutathione S-transferase family protein [Acidiphilium sp. AL]|uniref:Glutathione S-transferase family protein n=1 Tax=Acidiphilium iwatense TaxID=768198 RepID=A0ABS9DSL7_9PROT|nr:MULTISPECIES: glutathione S-transferase family protein [Acidiphilium]MCF3945654.1 glutathione S-transferase family protein [Acidiphilium iwatense]MCU4159539.1 glutathione S-transferase family protein [Acidiphilium sp. AL]